MGGGQHARLRLPEEDEAEFPLLFESGYCVSIPKDPIYNCIAFAAGDIFKKWDSSMLPAPGYYWPPGATRGRHPDDLKSAFEAIGYQVCAGHDLEEGFEKVALYVNAQGRWVHASRQDENGQWLSKLGDEEDIRHRSPHCFAGSGYGEVIYFMKRKSKAG